MCAELLRLEHEATVIAARLAPLGAAWSVRARRWLSHVWHRLMRPWRGWIRVPPRVRDLDGEGLLAVQDLAHL